MNANIRPRVKQNQVSRIKRRLWGKAQIIVSKGQEIEPQDIIGRSSVSAGFTTINIAKILRVEPQSGEKYLKREIGKIIYKGELLAFKKTILGQKTIVSPTDAEIDRYDSKSGEVWFKFLPKETSLISGVYGIVDMVDKEEGSVTIKTLASEIYGVVGLGKEREGVLEIISQPSQLVNPQAITQNLRQHILVLGSLVFDENLRQAIDVGVSGIIAGGINGSDFKSIAGSLNPFLNTEDIGITVLATEGFGSLPIGSDIYEVLKKHNERYMFIDGSKKKVILPEISPDSMMVLRKTALPQTLEDTEPEIKMDTIKEGIKVRIIWHPYMGYQGKVLTIDQQPTSLPSGISTYLLTIETANQKIKVPYPNVEILG